MFAPEHGVEAGAALLHHTAIQHSYVDSWGREEDDMAAVAKTRGG